MTIAMASDHAGFALKQQVQLFLEDNGAQVKDFGCYDTESCDYPDYAHPLADAVEKGEYEFGIIICSTGNGICMTANKHQGIRAALCWDTKLAELARQHNNANVLALPASFISAVKALDIVRTFFQTDFHPTPYTLHCTPYTPLRLCRALCRLPAPLPGVSGGSVSNAVCQPAGRSYAPRPLGAGSIADKRLGMGRAVLFPGRTPAQ